MGGVGHLQERAEADGEGASDGQVGVVHGLEVEVGLGGVAGVAAFAEVLALCDRVSDGDGE